jgi:hypothetical protein
MKKMVFTLLCITIGIVGYCQSAIIGAFNTTSSGRNVNLVYSKQYNKNEFGIGLRYNINKLAHPDDQFNVYVKRLYATKFPHYWGISLFYNRYLVDKWACVKPFLFYNLQSTYSTTRNRFFLPVGTDTNGDVLYKEYIEKFGPFTWIEQAVGFGVKVNINEKFFLTQKLGAGVTFILGKDENVISSYDKFNWEFGGLIYTGIGYKLF